MKKRKKLLLILGVPLAIVVVVAAVVVLWLDSGIRKVVEHSASHYLKVPVTLGKVRTSLLAGRAELTGLSVPNPPGFATPNAIRVGAVSAKIRLSTVLNQVPEIPEIRIDRMELTVEGSTQGSNLGRLIANARETLAAEQPSSGAPPAKEQRYRVGRLVITNAQLNLSATFMGGHAATTSISRIELTDLSSEMTVGDIIDRALTAVAKSGAGLSGGIGDAMGGLVRNIGSGAAGAGAAVGDAVKGVVKGLGDLFKSGGSSPPEKKPATNSR